MSRLRSLIPAPLAWLMGAVLVIATAWAFLLPPGQSPDESPHLAYAQSIAENLERPPPEDSEKRDLFSTEQELARTRANIDGPQGRFRIKPEWNEEIRDIWQREQSLLGDREREDGGGPNPAAGNPPAYYVYVYVSVPYATVGGSLFDRWYAMRLWSALLLLAGVIGAWLLIGELSGRDRVLQLAGAAVVGLWPMASFISASVNPDAAVNALWALALWLGVRLLRGGFAWRPALGLAAVAAACALTKPVGLALIPPVALALGLSVFRSAGSRARRRLVPAAAAAGLLVVGAAALGASRIASPLSDFRPGGFASYLWQFYLPRAGFLENFDQLEPLPVWGVWLKTGWAAFGWLEVRFPEGVYVMFALLTAVWLGGGLWALARGGAVHLTRAEWAFLGLAAVGLVGGLHLAEWQAIEDRGDVLAQGRYLLPLLPLGGLAVAALVGRVSEERRAVAVSSLLGALFAFQIFSLAIVCGRFYA